MKLTKKRLNQIIVEEKARLNEAPKLPDEMIEMARQRVLVAIEKLEADDHVGVLPALDEAAGLIAQAQDIGLRAISDPRYGKKSVDET